MRRRRRRRGAAAGARSVFHLPQSPRLRRFAVCLLANNSRNCKHLTTCQGALGPRLSAKGESLGECLAQPGMPNLPSSERDANREGSTLQCRALNLQLQQGGGGGVWSAWSSSCHAPWVSAAHDRLRRSLPSAGDMRRSASDACRQGGPRGVRAPCYQRPITSQHNAHLYITRGPRAAKTAQKRQNTRNLVRCVRALLQWR